MRSASLRSSAPRFVALSFGHSPDVNAWCAALTARSASRAPPLGISAQGLPVKGLSLGKVSPESDSTHSPPMNIRYFASAPCGVSMSVPERLDAEQRLAEAVLEGGAFAHRQHERRGRRRHLDRAEHRAGLAIEARDPGLELLRGVH